MLSGSCGANISCPPTKIVYDSGSEANVEVEDMERVGRHLDITEDDLLEAKDLAAKYSLEDVRDVCQKAFPQRLPHVTNIYQLMTRIYKLHRKDPNFSIDTLREIEAFLGMRPASLCSSHGVLISSAGNDDIFDYPEAHEEIISEMKIQAALFRNNSPYPEVRSVVDNHDDPTMPVSTVRAWIIGVCLSVSCAFINVFFGIRQPAISVSANVPQLLAYPCGKLLERVLPDWGFTLFGVRHSLNPGPFNRKEHMLITIMASISIGGPYTSQIVWIQALPQWFNQPWAVNFGYQTLIGLSTNFIGFSLAGITRRFLVYPSHCIWPGALATIALNTSFHEQNNPIVAGPLKKFWSMTRMRFFTYASIAMFCYFWLPNTLFSALTFFSWIAWIAPNNRTLAIITGSTSGLGVNPLPTFDWNIVTWFTDPLVIPFFSTFNLFLGTFFTMFIVAGIYFSNSFNTSYLPIISNEPWDHFAQPFNVTAVLNEDGILDIDKYQNYSMPYLSAGNVVSYMFFFSIYTAALTYGFLYHRQEMIMGCKDLWNSMTKKKKDEGRVLDVHHRLMKSYKEVPEWWYMICLVFSVVVGCAGITSYPTNTSPIVVFFGILLTLIFIVPTGIIYAMTGVQVSLNVLAEFIGGSFVEGNALAMCFFKTYGVITCVQALSFAGDLKLAHYVKIPPRITFWAQMVPTLATTFVAVTVLSYQVHIEDVCTRDAPFRFTCPGETTFFTAAVLWGTVGPKRLWGVGGTYAVTLLGFPLGVALVVAFWALSKKYPENTVLRQAHPVVLLYGGLSWSPYNISYLWPAVPVAAWSWLYMRKRFLGWWSKVSTVIRFVMNILLT